LAEIRPPVNAIVLIDSLESSYQFLVRIDFQYRCFFSYEEPKFIIAVVVANFDDTCRGGRGCISCQK